MSSSSTRPQLSTSLLLSPIHLAFIPRPVYRHIYHLDVDPNYLLFLPRRPISVHLALAADQLYATHPDLSSFHSADDVVDRLLPYHIFNIPDEDLVPTTAKGKGKARARDWDVAQLAGEVDETEEEERARESPPSSPGSSMLTRRMLSLQHCSFFSISGLKEVISFAKRKRAIEKRFEKLRTADGQVSHSLSFASHGARS